MVSSDKIQRTNRILEALQEIGGAVDDVTFTDEGDVEIEIDGESGDVTPTGGGVIIKNGSTK